MSPSDDDWAEVEQKLPRVQGKWGRLMNLLVRDGADRRTAGRFYVVVVQAVLLSGSETWVVTPRLDKALEGFHHQVVLRMAGMGPKHQQYGPWEYPPIWVALATVGVDEIGVYMDLRQNTVAQYIATFLIMDLCLVAEPKLGLRLSRRWWEHPDLDILGIRVGRVAAEAGGRQGRGGKGIGRVG